MTELQLLKFRLGFTNTAKDDYLTHILESTKTMLTDEKKITINTSNANHLGFIVNYSAWVYESKGEMGGMPRHLQYALHNLIIHSTKAEGVDPIV